MRKLLNIIVIVTTFYGCSQTKEQLPNPVEIIDVNIDKEVIVNSLISIKEDLLIAGGSKSISGEQVVFELDVLNKKNRQLWSGSIGQINHLTNGESGEILFYGNVTENRNYYSIIGTLDGTDSVVTSINILSDVLQSKNLIVVVYSEGRKKHVGVHNQKLNKIEKITFFDSLKRIDESSFFVKDSMVFGLVNENSFNPKDAILVQYNLSNDEIKKIPVSIINGDFVKFCAIGNRVSYLHRQNNILTLTDFNVGKEIGKFTVENNLTWIKQIYPLDKKCIIIGKFGEEPNSDYRVLSNKSNSSEWITDFTSEMIYESIMINKKLYLIDHERNVVVIDYR